MEGRSAQNHADARVTIGGQNFARSRADAARRTSARTTALRAR